MTRLTSQAGLPCHMLYRGVTAPCCWMVLAEHGREHDSNVCRACHTKRKIKTLYRCKQLLRVA